MKRIGIIFFILCLVVSLFSFQGLHSAEEYYFDGMVLGDPFFATLGDREPYTEICDVDPIDGKRRRLVVYSALPCRKKNFPDNTTVLYYLRYSEKDPLKQPIVAFAFLRGRYFVGKTNFPLRPGLTFSGTIKKRTLKSFDLIQNKSKLKVYKYDGDIYCLTDKNLIIGFVFGKMPNYPENEQWEAIIQMYDRYTPKFK